MSEYPYFFKVNQINKDQDTFTASSGAGVSENVADYDRTTKWTSVGSNDTTTESIEVEFKDADGIAENRTIDRVILSGCNAKLFRIYTSYWNGSTYDAYVLKDTVSANSIENHIRTIASTSCGKVKIEMDTTIIVDAEKYVAEFVCTQLIWESTTPMDIFQIKNKQKAVMRRLYSGAGQLVHHYDKWSAKIEFRQITKTELDQLRAIYDLHSSFIVILEPYDSLGNYDKPEEFYRVLWSIPWEQKYFTKVKNAGYNVKIVIEEV